MFTEEIKSVTDLEGYLEVQLSVDSEDGLSHQWSVLLYDKDKSVVSRVYNDNKLVKAIKDGAHSVKDIYPTFSRQLIRNTLDRVFLNRVRSKILMGVDLEVMREEIPEIKMYIQNHI